MTLTRRSLDHTIVQLNQKIIVRQMIQDPFTVSHQLRERRMFDGERNTYRADHWMQEFPNGCYCVPGYLFARNFQHMLQSLLIV